MHILTPGERLNGTPVQRRRLRSQFGGLRADPQPSALPGITFVPLPYVLASGLADPRTFSVGYDHAARRFSTLGMPAMLPLSRVCVGISSDAPPGEAGSIGGFHHPGQGYRHLQMTATITAYGNLLADRPASPQSIALDLLRSYTHDCLHYGTFRRYALSADGQPVRVQYGINFRSLDGRTYSAPDPPGAATTRNLGIIMEGATDTEATTIARDAAAGLGITRMDRPAEIAAWAFPDTTGTLTPDAMEAACQAGHPYLTALSGFARAVTSPYRAFLGELAGEPAELHQLIITAMISGRLGPLEAWLGTGRFARLFRSDTWDRHRKHA